MILPWNVFVVVDVIAVTIGTRSFKTESSLKGTVGGLFGVDTIDNESDESGQLWKLNLNYELDDKRLLYVTYSEGYRSGGANRLDNVEGFPPEYDSDLLVNYEFGWKTTWLDDTLRFNGAIYFMEWQDAQFSTVDFDISFLTFVDNVGDVEITGVETDLTYLPMPNLTLSAAFSYNDGELTEPFTRGDSIAPKGSALPFAPEWKLALSARYEFSFMDRGGYYSQFFYNYTDDSVNSIFPEEKEQQASYELANVALGYEQQQYGVELRIDNLFDETAELFKNNFDASDQITTNRPRTIGLHLSYKY